MTMGLLVNRVEGDGLLHRTAWAGAGDGVLFYDPDGRNEITEKRQYVFTEWDPTAKDDLDAVRSVFDANGDGKLTVAGAVRHPKVAGDAGACPPGCGLQVDDSPAAHRN